MYLLLVHVVISVPWYYRWLTIRIPVTQSCR